MSTLPWYVYVFISVGSTTVAIFAILSARNVAKIVTYAKIHELLVNPEAARGRKQLFLAHQEGIFPKPDSDEWDSINYALALYDTLGLYARQRMVVRKTVIRAWREPLQRISYPIDAFMAHRDKNGISQPWDNLQWLLRQVKK